MKVLIAGASGLIGSAIAARLASEGPEIVAVARRPPRNSFPAARWMPLDLAQATDPNDWTAVLAGIEAVVNCAGVLQDGPGDSTAGVHTSGPRRFSAHASGKGFAASSIFPLWALMSHWRLLAICEGCAFLPQT